MLESRSCVPSFHCNTIVPFGLATFIELCDYSTMPKRSSKPRDVNALARAIVAEATGEAPEDTRNPHAVALGRMGGLVGGKARAEKLSAKRRSEIARLAAEARWGHRQ